MRKALAASPLAGAAIAGATFVVLYPILGVALWIAFVAAGGALVASALAAGVAVVRGRSRGETHEPPIRMNPMVNVAVLRARYFVALVLALVGGFMVVESFAFSTGTAASISFALGIATAAIGVGFYVMRLRSPKQVVAMFGDRIHLIVWDVLALAFTVLGAWNIVQSLVFGTSTARWLTFADGLGLLGLSLAGLVLHELSTERVVHALEVVGTAPARSEKVESDGEPVRAG
jgi:hypothetical protein